MKTVTGVALMGLLSSVAVFAQEPASKATPPADPPLATLKDKASYALGLNIGRNLKKQSMEIDPAVLARGIQHALAGSAPQLTDDEIRQVFAEFQTQLQAAQAKRKKEQGEKNLKEGKAFLEENKTKEGVRTLASGLQYLVVAEGNGPMPKANDTVTTHYRGTLIDGTEFDSSYKTGEPTSFPVSGVIRGWTEALQRMKVGSKWKLFLPPELAYGEEGAGSDIGPNAVLVFEIELVAVE